MDQVDFLNRRITEIDTQIERLKFEREKYVECRNEIQSDLALLALQAEECEDFVENSAQCDLWEYA